MPTNEQRRATAKRKLSGSNTSLLRRRTSRPVRLLVAEDDPVMQLLLEAVFERHRLLDIISRDRWLPERIERYAFEA